MHSEQQDKLISNFWYKWTKYESLDSIHGADSDKIQQEFQSYMNSESWFSKIEETPKDFLVAFFSMEFGIDPSLPIYSGGLGVLAGDHLKSASDLGVPIIGIGLYYHNGFFQQVLDSTGRQSELYPRINSSDFPAKLVCDESGHPLNISVELAGTTIYAQIWELDVGRVKLYLLDTDVSQNSPEFREVTARLYDGGRENRIRQEILLGIGGVRALEKMGIKPKLYHMTEGHSAFLNLERARILRNSYEKNFHQCVEILKKSTVFTIHTPVEAGNETFSLELTKKYFDSYIDGLGINWEQFVELGRDSLQPDHYSLTVMALRMAGYCNGVSRLHGETSRRIWQHLWENALQNEVPITHITNGVHPRTWISNELLTAIQDVYSEDVDRNFTKNTIGEAVKRLSDSQLWSARKKCKAKLISFVREHYQYLKMDETRRMSDCIADDILSPDVLTVGFARRFASYKRATLLLRDKDRLTRLLTDPVRPVQFIFSGKAHPQNIEGQDSLQELIKFSIDAGAENRLIFIENYDMLIARHMVQGVDVWLSNPRRPMEASATSGMKAAMNGVLNIGTLDGWWDEAYQPYLGWAIGHGEESDNIDSIDNKESIALFELFENEVAPLFYDRNDDNIPYNWMAMIRRSINILGSYFSSHRMVKLYVKKFYIPASKHLAKQE